MKDNSNISQELLETVERYHNKTMSQEEQQAFEQRLQNDAQFKILVNDIESFLFGIEQQALKEKLDEFHKELPMQPETEATDSKARSLHWRKIAAAVVVIIASASFWFFNGSSNDRLYDNYFKPDPGLPTTMSSSDNFAFYDAMVNYKQKDYKKAIRKWEVLSAKAPQNDTINYFLGSAYLADDMEDTSITYLEKVIASENSAFKNEAYYYLGLAYLKKEDLVSAKKQFNLSTMENAKLILAKLD